MKLLKMSVLGLFGTYNHDVKIMSADRITLILGENGLGKTAILKMLKYFFDEDFSELQSMKFDSFTLSFSSNIKVRVSKAISKNKERELKIDKIGPRNKIIETYIPNFKINSQTRVRQHRYIGTNQINLFEDYVSHSDIDLVIRRFVPHVEQVEAGIWYDFSRKRTYTSWELFERFPNYFPSDFLKSFQIPDWLKRITFSRKARFIESQRLLNKIKSEESKYKSAVVEYSQEIIEKIRSKRAEANDLSSNLDRTYPQRLIESLRKPKKLHLDNLLKELKSLEDKRKLLNSAGLIDTDESYIQPTIKEQGDVLNVLQLYINDSNQKLDIYNDLSKRIILFQNIINNRFLHKKIWIDKQTGFNFKATIREEYPIPISGLSSGEQHELILFYQLLFNTAKGSLLLIDEPEISLHVSWQNQFISDLKSVIEANEMDIVIATHSPDIISSYWNLVTELDKNNIKR